MSIANETGIMKSSFLEARDIINTIFVRMNAPEEYQVAHMTFDELVVALRRILGLWDGTYREPATAEAKHILINRTAYDHKMNYIIGTMAEYGDAEFHSDAVEFFIEQEGHYNSIRFTLDEEQTTVQPEDVLEGKTYYETGHTLKTGTMPYIGEKEILITDDDKEIEINEYGYYNKINVKIADIQIIYIPNTMGVPAWVQSYEYGKNMIISSQEPSCDEYEFKGWSLDPTSEDEEYVARDSLDSNDYERGDKVLLYGVWEECLLDDSPEAQLKLTVTYLNGSTVGQLQNNKETVTVTVTGGYPKSKKYKYIQRQWSGLTSYKSKNDDEIRDEEKVNSYKLIFNYERGYEGNITVTHTDKKGNTQTATANVKINKQPGNIDLSDTNITVDAPKLPGNIDLSDTTVELDVTAQEDEVIQIPTQKGTLTYNGSAQSPAWNNYNATKMTYTAMVTSATEAGTYQANFTPKAGYKWPDGTKETKSVNWVINEATT